MKRFNEVMNGLWTENRRSESRRRYAPRTTPSYLSTDPNDRWGKWRLSVGHQALFHEDTLYEIPLGRIRGKGSLNRLIDRLLGYSWVSPTDIEDLQDAIDDIFNRWNSQTSTSNNPAATPPARPTSAEPIEQVEQKASDRRNSVSAEELAYIKNQRWIQDALAAFERHEKKKP